MSKYDQLKAEHDEIRFSLPAEENAELDAMRQNGKRWDKLAYAGLAILLGIVGLGVFFA